MLAGLHLVVDIGIQACVVFVVILILILILLLFGFLATQPLEEIGDFLVGEVVVDVLRHALETSETAFAILCACADIRRGTHGVSLVGVGGKLGIEVEGVTLRKFQSQRGTEVAPRTLLGGKVVRHLCAQLINEADLHQRVFLITILHLDIVRDRHRHRASHILAGSRIEGSRIG